MILLVSVDIHRMTAIEWSFLHSEIHAPSWPVSRSWNEELRGSSPQKVTVAPKGRAPGYEILTGDGYHATAEDPGTSRGSAGKRVWNVLRF